MNKTAQRVGIKREGVSRISHDVRTCKSPLLFLENWYVLLSHTPNDVWKKDIFFSSFVLFPFLSSTLLHSCSSRYLSLVLTLAVPTSLTHFADSFPSSPKTYFWKWREKSYEYLLCMSCLKIARKTSFVCLFFVTGISVKVCSSFKLQLSCLCFS
jgi:hypothetical protein